MLGTVVPVYKDACRGRAKAARGLTEGPRHSVRRSKTRVNTGRTEEERATPEKCAHQVSTQR